MIKGLFTTAATALARSTATGVKARPSAGNAKAAASDLSLMGVSPLSPEVA
mgnify:CR=1 FL=1